MVARFRQRELQISSQAISGKSSPWKTLYNGMPNSQDLPPLRRSELRRDDGPYSLDIKNTVNRVPTGLEEYDDRNFRALMLSTTYNNGSEECNAPTGIPTGDQALATGDPVWDNDFIG
ncbi:MAG: hypothetical protein M1830_005694 [Pleopsidium flavum]|nr:MAG: hypothetical protein M1830_005694 [Pleopsidium flavum]